MSKDKDGSVTELEETMPKRVPQRDNAISRKRLTTLRRRRDFLDQQLDQYKGPSRHNENNLQRVEFAALVWAIEIAEQWVQNEPRREPFAERKAAVEAYRAGLTESQAEILRRRLDVLERRRDFLGTRIDDFTGPNSSRDQVEFAALTWAIHIAQAWVPEDPWDDEGDAEEKLSYEEALKEWKADQNGS